MQTTIERKNKQVLTLTLTLNKVEPFRVERKSGTTTITIPIDHDEAREMLASLRHMLNDFPRTAKAVVHA